MRFGRKSRAAAGSVVFFFVAPAVVAGLIPWLLTGWDARAFSAWWLPVRVLGVALVLAGAVVLVHAFARFVVEGIGTPAPIAPTEHLVVGGLYRYVRNPMYLAVGAVIVGQALILGRLVLFPYAAVFGFATWAFVRGTRSRRCRSASARNTRRTDGRCPAGGPAAREAAAESQTWSAATAEGRQEITMGPVVPVTLHR